MADYLVVKIDITDGASTTTKIVSEIVNSNLQLMENTPSSSIAEKWDMSSLDETDVNEIVDMVSEARELATETMIPNTTRVYVDAVTIV